MRISDWSSDVCSSDLQAIANAHARAPDQLVFVSVTAPPEMVREYDAKGLLAFEDPSRAISALAALSRFRENFEKPIPQALDLPAAGKLVLPESGKLNEAEAKALLARCGVPSPREEWARSEERRVGKGWVSRGRSRWSPYT